jgi:hypothetical protein
MGVENEVHGRVVTDLHPRSPSQHRLGLYVGLGLGLLTYIPDRPVRIHLVGPSMHLRSDVPGRCRRGTGQGSHRKEEGGVRPAKEEAPPPPRGGKDDTRCITPRTYPEPQPSFRKLETKTLPPFFGSIFCQVMTAAKLVASALNGQPEGCTLCS